ncbi:phosphosulfolactate synthase [Amycolatopsis pithecellobii]|uniref:phosphosulfolactate synthase n=1 Tax=Amycolatopsis pithecellobii TaxID=664692 RepID=UPI001407B0C9|nr:phosphosulfolactate synthase [Amycolatopsis pithecellobii]
MDTTSEELPFAAFAVPERPGKPRTTGLSMMSDWGMGLGRQADTLESSGTYIDFAKVAAGVSRFMPRAVLSRKLRLYDEHAIPAFPGGLFAELALKLDRFESFVDEVVELGFRGVEISDNLLDLEAADKAAAISLAKSRGLLVFGEVGKKVGKLDDDTIVADVGTCLDAGADWVFLEASELFAADDVRSALVERLASTFPVDRLIFELPVVIAQGVTRDYKHSITTWLVRELGTQVGLANIEWDELYVTELVRRGFAGDTSHPQGVYRMAGFRDLGE